jgi:hypothetical protein
LFPIAWKNWSGFWVFVTWSLWPLADILACD